MTKEMAVLPPDIFEGYDAAEPSVVWKTLEGAEKEVTRKKVDIVGKLSAEERQHGEKGYIDRVVARLEIGEEKSYRTQIINYSRIFDVFRRPAPEGLGFNVEQTQSYPTYRLLAFAENDAARDFATSNPELTVEWLDNNEMTVPDIKLAIKESTVAKEEKPEEFTGLQLRLSKSEMEILNEILSDFVTSESVNGRAFSANESYKAGQACLGLALLWYADQGKLVGADESLPTD